MIFGFYRIITYKFNNNAFKVIFGIFCIGILFIIALIELFVFTQDLSQIIFGVFLGIFLYKFYFNYLLQSDNSNEFFNLFENNFGIKICLNVLILILLFDLFHYFFSENLFSQEEGWLSILNTNCKHFNSRFFDKESYFLLSYFYLLLSSYFFVFLEFKCQFKSDKHSFSEYNLESCNRWNQTHIIIQITRIILTIILYEITEHFYEDTFKKLSTINDLTVFSSFFILWGFLLFFALKKIFSIFNLTNNLILDHQISFNSDLSVHLLNKEEEENELKIEPNAETKRKKNKKQSSKINININNFLISDGNINNSESNPKSKINYLNLEYDNIFQLRNEIEDLKFTPDDNKYYI
jgi:hypothetical protein